MYNEPLLVKIMGLPRLIGKTLNIRTIYLYDHTDLILWPGWFCGFPFSWESQSQEFSDSSKAY
jgi:hypothetical protein